jgi:hypothetical protein
LTKRPQSKIAKLEPRLGIFWFFDGELLIDKAALNEAEPYDNHLTHPCGHDAVWEGFQRIGRVPSDVGYDEPPRGRAMFDCTTETSTILADKCILSRKDLLAQIRKELRLPKSTTLGTDSHYRCFACLYGRDVDDEDL